MRIVFDTMTCFVPGPAGLVLGILVGTIGVVPFSTRTTGRKLLLPADWVAASVVKPLTVRGVGSSLATRVTTASSSPSGGLRTPTLFFSYE